MIFDFSSFQKEFNIDILAKRGFLTKQGGSQGGNKNWKRRYCVLNENILSYYKSKDVLFCNVLFAITTIVKKDNLRRRRTTYYVS